MEGPSKALLGMELEEPVLGVFGIANKMKTVRSYVGERKVYAGVVDEDAGAGEGVDAGVVGPLHQCH